LHRDLKKHLSLKDEEIFSGMTTIAFFFRENILCVF
jgi:hypothetical protein